MSRGHAAGATLSAGRQSCECPAAPTARPSPPVPQGGELKGSRGLKGSAWGRAQGDPEPPRPSLRAAHEPALAGRLGGLGPHALAPQPLLGAPANLGLRPLGPNVHPAFPAHGVSGISRHISRDLHSGGQGSSSLPPVCRGGRGTPSGSPARIPWGCDEGPSLCSPERGRRRGALILPALPVSPAAARVAACSGAGRTLAGRWPWL